MSEKETFARALTKREEAKRLVEEEHKESKKRFANIMETFRAKSGSKKDSTAHLLR